MQPGEWLTHGTVWLALSLCVASAATANVKPGLEPFALSRWLNTLGCAAFLAHVACAFQFYHHWSHAAAYADTARQTAEFTGWNWGGGLFINHAFTLAWCGEVIWSWASPVGYLQRSRWITWSTRAFFLFMMVNGAFVFVRGPIRWLGLTLCLALIVCWWPRQKRIVRGSSQSNAT